MSSFEYLVALISIVAGLALTRSLSGLAKIIHSRRGRGVPGVYVAWTGSALLWLVAFWWFTFLLESVTWTIPLLLFVLAYAAVIYFLIALLYPDNVDAETDLFAYFLENRRWFFGTFVLLGVLDLADSWIKYQLLQAVPPLVPYTFLMLAWISLGTIGVVSESRTFHRAFAYSWIVVTGLWVTSSLLELGTSLTLE
jgi:hypothetical protein